MGMIIKLITSMTGFIPATCPLSEPCFPHSESVESVPGFISTRPKDSHLKGEGPDNRFSFTVCSVLLVQRYWVWSNYCTVLFNEDPLKSCGVGMTMHLRMWESENVPLVHLRHSASLSAVPVWIFMFYWNTTICRGSANIAFINCDQKYGF